MSISSSSSSPNESRPRSRHPLLHELVITNVLKSLSFKDLVSCRRVCQVWKGLSDPLVISQLDSVEIQFDANKNGLTRMSLYLDMLTEPHSLRFTNFHFNNVNLKSTFGQFFLEVVGPDIHYLNLAYPRSYCKKDVQYFKRYQSIEYPEESASDESASENDELGAGPLMLLRPHRDIDRATLQDLLTKHCPNLKRLKITNLPAIIKKSSLFSSEAVPIIPINQLDLSISKFSRKLLKDLFNRSPNLTTLSVNLFNSSFYETILMDALVRSRRMEMLKHVQFDSSGAVTIRSMSEILEAEFTSLFLTRLKMEELYSTQILPPPPSHLEVLLFNSRQSLKHLYISSVLFGEGDPITLKFPQMTGLEELSMIFIIPTTNVSANMYNLIGFQDNEELVYSVQFPNLKKLRIRGKAHVFKFWELTSPLNIGKPHRNLIYLEIPQMLNDEVYIKDLSRIFPNVHSLVIGAQNDLIFQTLWSSWNFIEDLHMSVESPYYPWERDDEIGFDSLLTGMSKEICKKINLSSSNDELFELLQSVSIAPSIKNVSHLRRLTLHLGDQIDSSSTGEINQRKDRISDVSCSYGFAQLPKLEYIKFGFETDVSQNGIEVICDSHPGMGLIKTVGSSEDDDGNVIVLGQVGGMVDDSRDEVEAEFWKIVDFENQL